MASWLQMIETRQQVSRLYFWQSRSSSRQRPRARARAGSRPADCRLRCVAKRPGKEKSERRERDMCVARLRHLLIRSHIAENTHTLSASCQVMPRMVCYTTNYFTQLERIISAMGVNQARHRASKHQGRFVGPRSLQTKAEVCWNGCPSRGRAKLENLYPQHSAALSAWSRNWWRQL